MFCKSKWEFFSIKGSYTPSENKLTQKPVYISIFNRHFSTVITPKYGVLKIHMSYSNRSISSTKIHVSRRGRESSAHPSYMVRAWAGHAATSITRPFQAAAAVTFTENAHTSSNSMGFVIQTELLALSMQMCPRVISKLTPYKKICHSTTLFLRHLPEQEKFLLNPRDSRPHRLSWMGNLI